MIHKGIFLIISSHDDNIYETFRNLQRVYLKNYRYLFRYFFVEFRNNQTELVEQEEDYIYIRGDESINPGMIIKTCKAIEFINKNYEYEFIIRTNLSTVFHMPNLIEYLNIIPNINSCGGFICNKFITGTGIILSKDVANKIVDNFFKFNIIDYNEDVLISVILNNLQITYFNPNKFYKWCLIVDKVDKYTDNLYIPTNGEYKDIDFPDNILYFRIKNIINREIDILYFKQILNKIYNIVV